LKNKPALMWRAICAAGHHPLEQQNAAHARQTRS
jgi:hypothetical protein